MMQTSQQNSDASQETYQIFKFDTCPFCLRVRLFVEKNNIPVTYRDIHRDREARAELIAGGGKSTVPCLRIERGGEVTWMYESADIVRYLRDRHAAA